MLFPPDIESILQCEQIHLQPHRRGKVFLSLTRLPSLCCDNEKRRFILMEFHTDETVVQEPKGDAICEIWADVESFLSTDAVQLI